jgi:hypothetical protein
MQNLPGCSSPWFYQLARREVEDRFRKSSELVKHDQEVTEPDHWDQTTPIGYWD